MADEDITQQDVLLTQQDAQPTQQNVLPTQQDALPMQQDAPPMQQEVLPQDLGKQQPIQVRTITVRTGRIAVDVVIPNEGFRYTTPRLAAFVEGQYPDLPHHACVNPKGFTFGDVIECTSVPHLLEHVVISLQVRERAIGDPTFIGTTEWTNEEAGEARVEFGFQDDLVALRAFNEATQFVNMAVLTCLS